MKRAPATLLVLVTGVACSALLDFEGDYCVGSDGKCNGSSQAGMSGSGGASGSAGAAAGNAGNVGSGGTSSLCEAFAATMCQARAKCCLATWGFDDAKCRELEQAGCEQAVARDLTPWKVEGCAAEIEKLACEVYRSDYLTKLLPMLRVCAPLIDGTLPPGEPCFGSYDCAQVDPAPGAAETITSCYDAKCTAVHLLVEGATCSNFGQNCNVEAECKVCGPGLFCQISKCATETPVGAPCASLLSLECGYTAYCAAVDGGKACSERKLEGAACAANGECASLDCTTSKQCGGPSPTFPAVACGK